MARGRSGSAQTMTVGVVELDTEAGLGPVSVALEPSEFEVTSGGLTRTQNAGQVAAEISFSVLETEVTNALFLGRNGARDTITWSDGATTVLDNAAVVLTVTRSMEARGPRRFEVEAMVDGSVTP